MPTTQTNPRSLANLKANAGKGRKKGVPNKVTAKHAELALFLAKNEIMDKPELLARLSRLARADIGKHLKIEGGVPIVSVDAEHTDIIREVTVRNAGGDGPFTEVKLKIADPRPALVDIAEILGLKKLPAPTVNMNELVQILQVNVAPADLLRAAEAALAAED